MTTRDLAPPPVARPDEEPPPVRRSRRRLPRVPLAVLALLAGLVGLAVPLAPVVAAEPVISWPMAGQLPEDTLVPLVPYRPRGVDADVPCSAIRAVADRGGGEVLRTRDARSDALTLGLVVAVEGGELSIVAGNDVLSRAEKTEQQQRPLVVAPIPAGDCVYRYASGDAGTTVTLDDRVVFRDPLLLPPRVEKLRTDLAGAPTAAGLRVEIRPDARFATSPTLLKKALIVLDVLLLAAVLVAARRRWPGRPTSRPTSRPARSLRPHPADAVVAVVTVAWLVLGPLNIDDGWYLQMALAAQETGVVGNTVGQYSVAENPFVLWQYLMQLWSANGWSLLWMRVLVGLVGLGTYALLRSATAVMVGRVAERRRLRRIAWFLAAGHLLWWLPYGITLRPEPLLVLGSAGALLLAETARRRGALAPLIAAVAVASVSTTVSPSGLVAWAPILVQSPWVLRLLATRPASERLTAALVACVAAGAAVPIAFADASLGTVLETHTVQRFFYPHLTWYDEVLHLAGLFEPADVAAWGRRLPVFLTFAVGALALAAARGRRPSGGARAAAGVEPALLRMAAVTGLATLSLSISPTKWVIHYGALAAFGTVLLALAGLRFPVSGARWSTGARLSGAGVVALAAAAAYAGPNLWRPITDWGQPFGQHPSTTGDRQLVREFAPHLGPFFASDILLWVVLGGAVFALLVRLGLGRRRAASGTGVTLLRVAAGGGVLLMVVVFVAAPLRQAPGWSLAQSNLRAATGGDCGLADSVQVAGGETAEGFVPATEAFGNAPVFVDVKVRAVWPCQRSTVVADGLVELPTYRILAGEGYRSDTDLIYRSAERGAVHTVLDREATVTDLPARQLRVGEQQTRFGVIQRVRYTLPPGRVDVRSGSRTVAGWTRGPELVPSENPAEEEAEERRRDAIEQGSAQ